ncbi:hypothetical protein ADK70_07920 [Streptomyces rimosus subsp. pseudoverticillatus]|nr:hypothetical protein ADK70_07920 [Streptomyces rimosus subsp. pseudoverticillatus]
MLGGAGITAAAADVPAARHAAGTAQAPSHQAAEIKGRVLTATHLYLDGKPVHALKKGDLVVLKCWTDNNKNKTKFYNASHGTKHGYVAAKNIHREGPHEPVKCQ